MYFAAMQKLWLLVCLMWTVNLNAQKLFPVEKKGKWGYMDEGGKMVIDFKYDLDQKFNEGYASVALGNMPCLIDINEKRIVDTGIYQFIGMYSEGLVSVMDYKFKRFYLSNKGAVALSLPIEIYDARPFYKGLARVGKKVDIVQNKFGFDISNLGYMFGYMRKDGSMATGFDFEDCDDFEEGVSRFMQGTKFGLIDSSSKVRLEPSYQMISAFNEDIAVVNAMGKFGYINKDGKELIAATYDYAMPFNEGLAAVEIQGKLGFINTSGELVIQPLYDDVRPFSAGRAGVLYMGKWAFIDAKGNYIYQPYFEAVGYFNEGVCPVKVKGKWGAIDLQGKILVPFEFDNVGIFENGIAEVIYRDLNLYVNKRGELLPKL